MTVVLEQRGSTRIVRIDRPERRNALGRETLEAIVQAAKLIGADRDARAIVITGTGAAFVAGGDLQELASLTTAAGGREVHRLGHRATDALRRTKLPLIAAVNGDAFGGGCELAAACDYRFAERHARFHWVQGRLAVTTGWGGTARLLEIVGSAVAARWLLTARTVDTLEARDCGFVDEVVETGTSVDAACAFASEIATVPRETTRLQLELIRGAASKRATLARAAERKAFGQAWASQEHQDAVARFLARKR